MSYPHQTQTPAVPEAPPPSASERAGQATEQGKVAAGQVAQTATEHAHEVKDEAVRQARDLLDEARHEVSQQAGQQHRSLVVNLRSLSSELGAMKSHAGQTGVATDLAGQAQQRVAGLADWLEQREPGQVVDEVRDFARRRPATFLLGALAAGLVAGRLTRGAVEVHSNNDSAPSSPPAQQAQPGYTPAHGATPTPAPPAYEPPTYEPPAYEAPTYAPPASPAGDAAQQPTETIPANGAWR
jgi:hypothetical protein